MGSANIDTPSSDQSLDQVRNDLRSFLMPVAWLILAPWIITRDIPLLSEAVSVVLQAFSRPA